MRIVIAEGEEVGPTGIAQFDSNEFELELKQQRVEYL